MFKQTVNVFYLIIPSFPFIHLLLLLLNPFKPIWICLVCLKLITRISVTFFKPIFVRSFLVNLLEFSTNDAFIDKQCNAAAEEHHPPHQQSLDSAANQSQCKKPDTYNVIPRFYHKLPRSNDMIAQKLREEARTLFLQKRSKELLDNNELKLLGNILQKNYTPPSVNNEHFINYDDFLHVIKIAGEKFK